jgi:DivIVA domain-containing protein
MAGTSVAPMPVSPQQLRSLRFDEGIRGYDKRQVDKVIQRVADLVEDLEIRLADAERRATDAAGDIPTPTSGEAAELDETLRRTLILAQRTADAAVKEAREDAARIRNEARAEADELLADARSQNEKVTSEVDSERARLLAEARQDCEQRIARVEAELHATHEAKRTELIEQVNQLTQIRDLLADDIERLEGHVAARRVAITAALAEVQAVLDDPDKLRAAEPGSLDVVQAHDVEGYEPVSVRIEAMDGFPEASPAPEQEAGDEAAVAGDSWDDEGDGYDDGGPPTELHPVVGDAEASYDDDDDDDDGGADDDAGDRDQTARPAWADAVPHATDAEPADALVGRVRRGTGTGEDAEAMDRFFTESDEDRRSGWFRRKP